MSERIEDTLARINAYEREQFARASLEEQQDMLQRKAWEITSADQEMSEKVAGWGAPPISPETAVQQAQDFFSQPHQGTRQPTSTQR
ncbi:hypothetical protein A2773_03480 [Candidatus Gottesmanbacteria bacterium RIFCSPHIGHO2_01_FULL_39_10]|uniref:Uncharacterized protein n=1 Tax=Candidatus Gottesmanbacteria bacterium RIFCSPHIGHO2_01_FULL_39_10 TaxID=1798375 RepID=A0A1F5ZPM4_9BACT|nr:MAG: hypothetical protein A2773_03480 [Candidatus Gottesmanbacteria bacterium RIFCSPHIGHO2_01_FULL_39_10]